jgi:hypothetical protein
MREEYSSCDFEDVGGGGGGVIAPTAGGGGNVATYIKSKEKRT